MFQQRGGNQQDTRPLLRNYGPGDREQLIETRQPRSSSQGVLRHFGVGAAIGLRQLVEIDAR
jgi:hypothetical protein